MAVVATVIAFILFGFVIYSQYLSERGQAEHAKQINEALSLERSEGKLWSPQSEALIHAFPSLKSDFIALLNMMETNQVFLAGLLGDQLHVSTKNGSEFYNEDVPDREVWLELMERASVISIYRDERFDMTAIIPSAPRTTSDRNETINFFLNHPYPAKQCSDQYRDIPCGVCDVAMGDDWSVRFSWSSGAFESEYTENFARVYQDDDFVLSKDDIDKKLEKARNECKRHGLEEMGYENPELY